MVAGLHRVGSVAAFIAAIYFLILFNVIPLPFFNAETTGQIVSLLPWWLLVSFGAYSLWSIGWGLLTLRECSEAYEELLSEIAEAKDDLRTKGVTVD